MWKHMKNKWERTSHVTQICGYESHDTNIISFRTILNNNWLAEFRFDISVKFYIYCYDQICINN